MDERGSGCRDLDERGSGCSIRAHDINVQDQLDVPATSLSKRLGFCSACAPAVSS